MKENKKTSSRKDADVPYISTFPLPRTHWTMEGRRTLERLWKKNVERGREALSMDAFARDYGLSEARIKRELRRGFTGVLLKDKERGGWIYPEYSAVQAQRAANLSQANKGRRSVVTNKFADELVKDLGQGLSVASCLHRLENEGWTNLPKQRTVYYHLKEGVIVLPKGKLRYCPRKTKRRHIPMRAKVLPERTSIEDRPPEINGRERMGDWEMDCVVSGRSGKGGLLVMVDRRSRYTLLRRLPSISQKAVLHALRAMVREDAFHALKSVTTDNGTEFLDQKRIEKSLGVPVYYTHAYASYEKGTVEQTNGLLRFWWDKGSDFSRVSRQRIANVQHLVNSISRTVTLKGLTAYEAISALS